MELNDAIRRISGLEGKLHDALETEGAATVRSVLVQEARRRVYDAYQPDFYSRRNGNGGILDPGEIDVDVVGLTLTASSNPDWQHLWGGHRPDGRLAEAIASGNPRFNMGKAGPRPWHEAAKERLIGEGLLEDAIRRGLARQGVDASGIHFSFR